MLKKRSKSKANVHDLFTKNSFIASFFLKIHRANKSMASLYQFIIQHSLNFSKYLMCFRCAYQLYPFTNRSIILKLEVIFSCNFFFIKLIIKKGIFFQAFRKARDVDGRQLAARRQRHMTAT